MRSAQPVVRIATFDDTAALTRMHHRCSADSMRRRYGMPPAQLDDRFSRRQLLDGGGALVAAIGANVVGVATISTCKDAVAEVSILVEDGWQRSGLGTRLLTSAARLARGQGAAELVLRSRTHHPALMSLAFGSGLRARIRREGESVLVTVGLDGLKPLTTVPVADDVADDPRQRGMRNCRDASPTDPRLLRHERAPRASWETTTSSTTRSRWRAATGRASATCRPPSATRP